MQQQMHEKMDRNMSTLAHEVGSFVSHELGGIWQVLQQSVFPPCLLTIEILVLQAVLLLN